MLIDITSSGWNRTHPHLGGVQTLPLAKAVLRLSGVGRTVGPGPQTFSVYHVVIKFS